MVITGTIENFDIAIMCDDPWQECYLKIDLTKPEMNMIDRVFPNALVLSANLRDTISLGLAIDFLEQNNVPRTHPLWDLNHSNLWQRS